LDTTIAWDKFNINLRTVLNDDVFNSFKIFYKASLSKSLQNDKPASFIKTKRDLEIKAPKLKTRKQRAQKHNLQRSNYSLDMESLTDDDNSINSIYYLKTNNLVNLKIEYNKSEKTEIYENEDSKEIFRVQYNELGLPINFITSGFSNTNLNYDSNGRLISWRRGNKLKEEYVYDLKGRLIEVKYNNGDSLKYSYADGTLVSYSRFKL
jgi:YD repeat-containing protein